MAHLAPAGSVRCRPRFASYSLNCGSTPGPAYSAMRGYVWVGSALSLATRYHWDGGRIDPCSGIVSSLGRLVKGCSRSKWIQGDTVSTTPVVLHRPPDCSVVTSSGRGRSSSHVRAPATLLHTAAIGTSLMAIIRGWQSNHPPMVKIKRRLFPPWVLCGGRQYSLPR